MVQSPIDDAATWLAHGGRPQGPGAPLNHPIVAATNFMPGGEQWYSRSDGTDTVAAIESVVGGLEAGEAVAFASGMAAIAAILDQVPPGGTVAVPSDCYHGLVELAKRGEAAGRYQLARVQPGDTEAWIEVLGSDLVWLETPTNPLLETIDVAAICARPRLATVVVDSTFLTPLRMQPLRMGADIVVHSASKFFGGHSDLVMGLAVAATSEQGETLRQIRSLVGASPGALEAFLALRGIRTLGVRLEAMEKNARILAGRLATHPAVKRVRYPGLGAVISFELKGGDAAADAACLATSVIRHTTSVGGVETTMERRSGYPGSSALPSGLIRMSVGLESAGALWRDLESALSD